MGIQQPARVRVKPGDESILLGTLALEKGQPIHIGVNSLFASHIGIFGNTGSGKSYTLAKIYRELFCKFFGKGGFATKAKFVIIDFNGEYVGEEANPDIIVNADQKTMYRLSTRDSREKLPLEKEVIGDPQFWITFLEATEKTQTPFLRRAIFSTFIDSQLENSESFKNHLKTVLVSVLTSGDRTISKADVIGIVREIGECLDENRTFKDLESEFNAHLQFHSTQGKFYYSNPLYWPENQLFKSTIEAKVDTLVFSFENLSLIDRIRLKIVLQYYRDIFSGFANKEHLAPLLKRLDKRIDSLKKVVEVLDEPPEEKNIVVISLKDVNLEMRKILPLLFCKQLYKAKKENGDPSTYLNIIVDEAHNVLSEKSDRESEQWKDYRLETFEEIIKEGRKFGVFLTIASQRPADISPTIISQLHNYFLHRLINHEDIRAVEKTISYLDKVSFESLPILPTGTCVLAGLGASVPVVIDIGPITPSKHEPY